MSRNRNRSECLFLALAKGGTALAASIGASECMVSMWYFGGQHDVSSRAAFWIAVLRILTRRTRFSLAIFGRTTKHFKAKTNHVRDHKAVAFVSRLFEG